MNQHTMHPKCYILTIFLIYLFKTTTVANYLVNYEEETDVDEETNKNSVIQRYVRSYMSNYKHPKEIWRMKNWQENITSERQAVETRVRRGLVVRCCGLRSCFPAITKKKKFNAKAYAKLTWEGVSISCPGCPKGWHSQLLWNGAKEGIPVECSGCPEDWESLVNFEMAETTDAPEEENTDEETTEPDEEDEKTTKYKSTTKTSSKSSSTSTITTVMSPNTSTINTNVTSNAETTSQSTAATATTVATGTTIVNATTVPVTSTISTASGANTSSVATTQAVTTTVGAATTVAVTPSTTPSATTVTSAAVATTIAAGTTTATTTTNATTKAAGGIQLPGNLGSFSLPPGINLGNIGSLLG